MKNIAEFVERIDWEQLRRDKHALFVLSMELGRPRSLENVIDTIEDLQDAAFADGHLVRFSTTDAFEADGKKWVLTVRDETEEIRQALNDYSTPLRGATFPAIK